MKTVADLIDRNADWFPNNEAFVIGDQRVTYGAFAERCRKLGSSLYQRGLLKQERVGIFSTNSIEYFEIYGACELSGYISAVYNFRCAPPELAYLLKDSAPQIVFFGSEFTGIIDAIRSDFTHITWVCIDATGPEWSENYADLVASGDASGAPLRPEEDEVATLFYTSGTTGYPKGVPWTHRASMAMANLIGRQIGQGSKVLQFTPAYHVGGKGYPLGASWFAGTVVMDQAGFDPGRFLNIIEQEKITFTFMVPPMIQACLDHLAENESDVSSLRGVVAASTAIPADLLKRAIEAFGPVFFTAYGATEAGDISCMLRHELRPFGNKEDIKRVGSVGHFHPEIKGIILDEQLQPCPQGVVGEVCVQTPTFSGYWNNSVATIEATRSGWLHTGDLGYLDEEGFLYLVDRKKDMIISGGENIYSREVEEVLNRHSSVREVAVIGVPDEKWGESVKAILAFQPGQELSEEDLSAFCESQIAKFKCPRSYEVLDALPLLGPGKIDKATLRKQFG